MMVGAAGEPRAPSDDEKKVFENVKDQIIEKAVAQGHAQVTSIELLSVSSQVVSGTNYFGKVKLGDSYVHARVYVPLPHTGKPAEVHSIQANKTAEDVVSFFG
eukprot:GEMP01073267.1.p2 GENE.GEMP01073267.1~~GEMP01073267.1.p2  ORF type:complete len:103 (+),score=27.03 GEMP01073267.1:44-352(+)